MNELVILEKTISDLEKEINDKMFDIPFGNSQFQIENFILNREYTDARKYKAIGLNIYQKINALKENYYTLKELEIKIAILDNKITKEDDELKKGLLLIKKERKQSTLLYTKKLFNDAVKELEVFYSALKKLPDITREEFEKQEYEHYLKKLSSQALGINDSELSLISMGAISGDKAKDLQLIQESFSSTIQKRLEQ